MSRIPTHVIETCRCGGSGKLSDVLYASPNLACVLCGGRGEVLRRAGVAERLWGWLRNDERLVWPERAGS